MFCICFLCLLSKPLSKTVDEQCQHPQKLFSGSGTLPVAIVHGPFYFSSAEVSGLRLHPWIGRILVGRILVQDARPKLAGMQTCDLPFTFPSFFTFGASIQYTAFRCPSARLNLLHHLYVTCSGALALGFSTAVHRTRRVLHMELHSSLFRTLCRRNFAHTIMYYVQTFVVASSAASRRCMALYGWNSRVVHVPGFMYTEGPGQEQ